MNRSKQITIASILMFLLSAFGIVVAIPPLTQGTAAEAPPFFINVLGLALAVLGIVSAYGVWNNQKWGKILTIVICAINVLSALPGVFIAPTTFLWVSATGWIIVSVAIIILLLWPTPKSATV